MKIHAYKITSAKGSDIAALSEKILQLPLSEREFTPVPLLRLEHRTHSKNLLFLDFAKARYGHGPGKLSQSKGLTEVGLDADEAFGEDTGLVIDVASGFAAIQYNSHGPRVNAIAQYLSEAQRDLKMYSEDKYGFIFSKFLREDALARLKTTGLIKELEFDVAIGDEESFDSKSGKSLSRFFDRPFPNGTARVRIIIKAAGRRGTGLERKGVSAVIDNILDDRDSARALKVSGLDEHGQRFHQIDFLEDSLVINTTLQLKSGQRYSRSDRWNALDEAMKTWKAEGRY